MVVVDVRRGRLVVDGRGWRGEDEEKEEEDKEREKEGRQHQATNMKSNNRNKYIDNSAHHVSYIITQEYVKQYSHVTVFGMALCFC